MEMRSSSSLNWKIYVLLQFRRKFLRFQEVHRVTLKFFTVPRMNNVCMF